MSKAEIDMVVVLIIAVVVVVLFILLLAGTKTIGFDILGSIGEGLN